MADIIWQLTLVSPVGFFSHELRFFELLLEIHKLVRGVSFWDGKARNTRLLIFREGETLTFEPRGQPHLFQSRRSTTWRWCSRASLQPAQGRPRACCSSSVRKSSLVSTLTLLFNACSSCSNRSCSSCAFFSSAWKQYCLCFCNRVFSVAE